MSHKILPLVVLGTFSAGFLPGIQASEITSAPLTAETSEPVKPPASAIPVYELGGFFGSGDTLEISLKEVGTGSSRLYPLGRTTGGVLVEQADAKTGVAVIVVAGAHRTLSLAGETRAGTAGPTGSKPGQVGAELMSNYRSWHFLPRYAAKAVLKSSVDELLLNHPEYFEGTASKSPQANEALRELLLKYTEAGNALSNPGEGFTKTENLAEKIATVYGTLQIRSATDEELKPFGVIRGVDAKTAFLLVYEDKTRALAVGVSDPAEGIANTIAIATLNEPPRHYTAP